MCCLPKQIYLIWDIDEVYLIDQINVNCLICLDNFQKNKTANSLFQRPNKLKIHVK